ncbi:MAG: hypothetical protein QME71_04230 [Dehalococcoidia bacterium]|nr:hypothetical protein [Dehalococcoidia bacterium]
MLRRVPQAPSLIAVALIVFFSLLASWRFVVLLGLPLSPDDYDLAGWEVRHVTNKWLHALGSVGREGPNVEEENAAIDDYIRLQKQVEELEAGLVRLPRDNPGAPENEALLAELEKRRRERDRLENEVEAAIERRLSDEIVRLGLQRSLPLFSNVRWVFPPVDIEFDSPPWVLVKSPRREIRLESARLLNIDLTLEEVLELEEASEGPDTSALAVSSGGVATYPSVIPPMDDYARTLELAAHEWLHQYLFFQPLGARYFGGTAVRTINETVADIAGEEIGRLVLANGPLPQSAAQLETAPPAEDSDGETFQVMRQLRLDVDRLLAEGRVDEAEALMEEKRLYLAENGYYVRRINQAYFAFHGLYGTSPASSSPIGPKVERLRECAPSLREFVRSVSQVTSEGDLDRLLEECEAAATPP